MALTRPRAAQIYDIDYKQATRVVTVSDITLSGGAPNQVDGVNLSLKDRVLVTGQTAGAENGIYYVTTLGSGSNGTWTRSLDTDATGELLSGTIVMVTEGVIYADTQWKLTTNDPITIGATALTFVQNYSANSIASGNSNVVILTNANVLISSAGTANVVDVFGAGITITGTESVTGNATVGNLLTAGLISATGNTTAGNILTSGIVSSTGNLTSGNVNTVNISLSGNVVSSLNVTGNVASGNLSTPGQISATGNITTDGYVLGNVFYANGITASKIYSGNSEVNVTSSGGNVNVSIGGTDNVAVFSTTGEYVTGVVSVSGNVTGGNVLTAGLISATGNITTAGYFLGNVACASGIYASRIFNGTTEANIPVADGNVNVSVGGTSNVWVATSTGILITGTQSASGNITGGNILTSGLISATGAVYSGNIYTSGGLSLTGNTITSSGDTLTIDPNGSGAVDGNVVIAGNLSVQGNVTYIDSNVITTNEKSITLANNVNTGSLADGAGIDVGNNNLAYWRFNNATTSWQSNIGLTPVANNTLNLGGTSNYWANVYAGNTIISGDSSAAGNVTGNYINGNGSALTGINTFSNVAVQGGASIPAGNIATTLTFIAGNNIVLTANAVANSLQIDYSSSGGGTSIFATGGDMGLVIDPVTSSEDLGNVTSAATTSYDLGILGVSGVVSNSDIIANTITGDKINSSTYISITGNLTAANLAMTSSTIDIRGTWLAAGNSFNSSGQVSSATDVMVSSIGTKAYVLSGLGSVYQYSMSPTYSANTASYDNLSFSFTTEDTNPQSIARNSADTVAYMLGGQTATVYQYSYGATANIASLSYSSLSYSVSSQEPTPTGFAFNEDSSYMYVVGTTNQSVYQYQVANVGNIASTTYALNSSYSVAAQDTQPQGIGFSTDGKYMYILGGATQSIYQYTLTSAFDITTGVTYNGSYPVAPQDRNPTGMFVNTTKDYLYLTGSFTNNVFQYNIGNSTVITANATYQTGNLTVGNIVVTGNLLQNGNLYATQVQAMMYALAF